MAKTTVFLRDCRISFPALDEPKPQMMGGDPKYEVTALMAPDSEACKQLNAAVIQVAREGFGQQADRMLATPGFSPVRSGDDREKIPAGYAGMVYVTAKSKQRPDLRDSNPQIIITDPREIKEKFVGGYHCNIYVEVYSYQAKAPSGAIIKSGIATMLLGVQFAAYDHPFGGVHLTATDYPDVTAQAQASSVFKPADTPSQAQAPAAPAQQPQGAQQAASGNAGGYYGTAHQVNQAQGAPQAASGNTGGYYGTAQPVNQGSAGYYGGQVPDNLDNSDVPF